MKTTIEVNGFEITIEEDESGAVSVSASKEGEVVEEFTLEGDGEEGSQSQAQGGDIKGFEEFGQEEEDFEDGEGEEEGLQAQSQGEEDEEDLDKEDDDSDDEAQLESFQSFINRKRK